MRQGLRKTVFLLPSLLTTANIMLGFMAVAWALRGRLEGAAMLVFAAGVLDALDGRIARMTGTDTDFGEQFDSMADMMTFGMVPALLAYLWGLEVFGRLGWLMPVFYVVCTASRLARFNVQIKATGSRYFVGLPAPAAAGSVASILFVSPAEPEGRTLVGILLLGALGLLGLLMVSTFRYYSLKHFTLRQRGSYRMVALIAAFLVLAVYDPKIFFPTVAVVYTTSGPLAWATGRLWRRARRGEAALSEEHP